MLRGIFMPPGVAPDQRAFYVDLLTKIRATPEWKEYMEKGSPVAVGLPLWNDPYHEAHPTCPRRDSRASAGAVVAANQTPRSVRQSMVARMMVTRTSTLHGWKGHVSSHGNDVMTWGRLKPRHNFVYVSGE